MPWRCQCVASPNTPPPKQGRNTIYSKTSTGLARQSQLYSKLGLRGEHTGKVTVGTDKQNRMCGHNGGGRIQNCTESGVLSDVGSLSKLH